MEKKTQIAKFCIKAAKETLGHGWQHVSDEVRWGLVASNLLGVIGGQDETISPERFREFVKEVMKETEWQFRLDKTRPMRDANEKERT